METKILVNCTHGRDEPERATVAFVVGNVSATAAQSTVVLLTCDGVWLTTQIWACGACTNPRGITATDLVPGAPIVTAATVVAAMAGGASTLSF